MKISPRGLVTVLCGVGGLASDMLEINPCDQR
jgi:hypothetical protein